MVTVWQKDSRGGGGDGNRSGVHKQRERRRRLPRGFSSYLYHIPPGSLPPIACLPCFAFPCFALSCLALPCLALPCFNMSWLPLLCPVMPSSSLPCFALFCLPSLALSRFALLCPTYPRLASPCLACLASTQDSTTLTKAFMSYLRALVPNTPAWARRLPAKEKISELL